MSQIVIIVTFDALLGMLQQFGSVKSFRTAVLADVNELVIDGFGVMSTKHLAHFKFGHQPVNTFHFLNNDVKFVIQCSIT